MTSEQFNFEAFQHLPSKVQKLLSSRVKKAGDFSELRCLHQGDSLEAYGKQYDEFAFDHPIDEVWKAYTESQPGESWKGPMVNFVFGYSQQEGSFYYPDQENIPFLQVGMQFYCWLNILGPRLIIGLKLLEADIEKKELAIAYIEGGLYRGVQFIRFKEKTPKQTVVEHESYFKSASWLMDNTLYPFFHKRTVGEFHQRKREQLQLIS
ncbi:MAG: hypothetical protein AAFY71_26650 [Bacteroidota bacterium]